MATCPQLELENLGLLPAEVLVREVAILSGLEVDRLGKVELLDNHTGSQVEVGIDNLDKLVRALIRGAVGVDEDGKGFGNANGVGELDESAAG